MTPTYPSSSDHTDPGRPFPLSRARSGHSGPTPAGEYRGTAPTLTGRTPAHSDRHLYTGAAALTLIAAAYVITGHHWWMILAAAGAALLGVAWYAAETQPEPLAPVPLVLDRDEVNR
jgi:hypothetical protein